MKELPYELVPFDHPQALAQAAAGACFEKIQSDRPSVRPDLVALSGGRIAKDFFCALTEAARRGGRTLANVHFFWADERCVPPSDAESNFALADQWLFQPLQIPAKQIHRIRGELPTAEGPLQVEATLELRRVAHAYAKGQPMFDIVFLGMGEDGHIASLFPNMSPEGVDSKEVYLAVIGPKPPPRRITLSYAAISVAREVWVLASGPGKTEALQRSLMMRSETPLGRLLGMRRKTRIFTDIPRV